MRVPRCDDGNICSATFRRRSLSATTSVDRPCMLRVRSTSIIHASEMCPDRLTLSKIRPVPAISRAFRTLLVPAPHPEIPLAPLFDEL